MNRSKIPYPYLVEEASDAESARLKAEESSGLPYVQLKCAAEIQAKPISWLWDGWLPQGKLIILAGAAGTGKTTLAIEIAATISKNGDWPDGSKVQIPGKVLIWSGEDSQEDTLVPRLMAAGADRSKCYFIGEVVAAGQKRVFDPAKDITQLRQAVKRHGNVSLLIIDPIVSVVSGDMHRANDVRRSLQSLVEFADECRCAVLGISHFSKAAEGKSPQDRVIGSQAFGALARMVLVAAKQEDGSQRVLARAKSNIAADDGGIAYSLDVATLDNGIETTRISWGNPIEGTARLILNDVEQHVPDQSEAMQAQQFLKDLLADGPQLTTQIKKDAEGAGYAWITIRRAKDSLGVEAYKEATHRGNWKWRLP